MRYLLARMIIIVVLLGCPLACSGAGNPAPGAAGGPSEGAAPPPPAGAPEVEGPAGGAGPVTAVATDIRLSPAARVLAEKFMCVCGCEMLLAECTCKKDPGGISMKKHLQSLVDRRLSPPEVSDEMVRAYGSAVLR